MLSASDCDSEQDFSFDDEWDTPSKRKRVKTPKEVTKASTSKASTSKASSTKVPVTLASASVGLGLGILTWKCRPSTNRQQAAC